MAKVFVIDEAEGTRFPFLRGILIRSLQDAGVPFDEAYALASKIRDELNNSSEITNEELRRRVIAHLMPMGDELVQRYLRPAAPPTILVRFRDGHTTPFSRGRHRLGLESCGVTSEDALRVSALVHDDLAAENVTEITARDLRHLTHTHLTRELGAVAARQYVTWQAFHRSDRPLIVLIGGAVGSGKSTVATQLAQRLDIVRIQSTDMLREVMRMMVPTRMVPALHTSSFLAWERLPAREHVTDDPDAHLIDGYLTQAELLSVACEAAINRAVHERVSLVLEGVHAHPAMLPGIAESSDAIVIRVMLAVLKPRQLRRRIRGRGKKEPGRRAKRYLEHFDSIWGLQSFMLSEADRMGVPIVPNEDVERTVQQLTGIIMSELAGHYPSDPDEVFE